MNSLLIAGNIIKRAFRNKKELLILTLLPIVIIGMMTKLSDTQITKKITNVGYINLDNGDLGVSLIDHLKGQQDINLVAIKENDIANSKSEKVSFSLRIPRDFSKRINDKQMTKVTFNTSESSLPYEDLKKQVNDYITSLYVIHKLADVSVLSDFGARLESSRITISNDVVETDTDQSNYEGRLSSMGFVTTFIMMLVFFSMGTLLEDKKRLTLARIFSHPVKEWEVVTGNLIGSLALGMMQLIPILVTLKIIFNIPWGEKFIGLSLILFAFLLTTIGLGVGLAGIIKNKFNPLLIITTVVIPTSILGGTFIPASLMPDILNKVGYIVPQKWVMNSLEKILHGEPLSTVFFNIGVILMFGLAFATFGTKTLKPLN